MHFLVDLVIFTFLAGLVAFIAVRRTAKGGGVRKESLIGPESQLYSILCEKINQSKLDWELMLTEDLIVIGCGGGRHSVPYSHIAWAIVDSKYLVIIDHFMYTAVFKKPDDDFLAALGSKVSITAR